MSFETAVLDFIRRFSARPKFKVGELVRASKKSSLYRELENPLCLRVYYQNWGLYGYYYGLEDINGKRFLFDEVELKRVTNKKEILRYELGRLGK